jgi:hypothetical protein
LDYRAKGQGQDYICGQPRFKPRGPQANPSPVGVHVLSFFAQRSPQVQSRQELAILPCAHVERFMSARQQSLAGAPQALASADAYSCSFFLKPLLLSKSFIHNNLR